MYKDDLNAAYVQIARLEKENKELKNRQPRKLSVAEKLRAVSSHSWSMFWVSFVCTIFNLVFGISHRSVLSLALALPITLTLTIWGAINVASEYQKAGD